ncbi:MAG: EAL domain-containing protein, partial [bacterium]
MADNSGNNISTKQLAKSKERLNSIYQNAPLPFISWNRDGKIIELNKAAAELFNWSPEEIKGRDFISALIAESDKEIWRNWQNGIIEKLPRNLISRAVQKDGSIIYCSWNNALIKEDGVIKEIITIAKYLKNYLAREMAYKKLIKAINETDNWVVITDTDGNIEYANTTVQEITGYELDEIIREDPSLFKSGRHENDFYKELWETIKSGEVFNDIIINKKKNGDLFYSEQTISPIKNNDNQIINFISVGKDITQNEKLKNKIEYVSNYDVDYSLPNRKAISTKVNDLIELDKLQKLAVIVIRIERIKHLNDLYASDADNKSLMNLAADLINLKANNKKNSVKIDKDHYLAYLGGDKFALIIDNINSVNRIYEIAEKLLDIFAEPVKYDGNSLMLNASVGISIYPDDCKNSKNLLSNAEIALMNSGSNDYTFFDHEMNKEIKEFTQTEAKLNQAIKNDDFLIYYQPYFKGDKNSLYGLEALLRWQDPDQGLIYPENFIPILEESKLIKKVGLIVVKKVVSTLQDWIERGFEAVPVSINLSAKQLEDSSHLDEIYRIITDSEIDNSLIKFEITESNAMNDVDYILKTMNKMKEKGFKIAIDDFGTGYSSFSYLHKFPIDYLKIDISFIENMTASTEGKNIVEAIINLAHALNLKTIAEGVEKKSELEELNSLNNDFIQGYYFYRPLPAAELEELL